MKFNNDNKSEKDFELILEENKKIQIIIKVKNYPIVKGLFDFLKKMPFIGEFIDSSMDNMLNNSQTKKRKELLDAIIKNINITKDMVNNVDFIMDFAKISEAIDRLSTNEKVKYFANLLKNKHFYKDSCIDNDIFDEYIYLLNNLSYRQIKYLCLLSKCTQEIKSKKEQITDFNIGQIYNEIQNKFIEEVSNIGEIDPNDIICILKSTPFVNQFSGVVNSNNGNIVINAPNCIYLEEIFDNFSNIIGEKVNE